MDVVVTLVTFSIEGGHLNLHLRIHDHEEDEDTILAAHPPLFKGSCPPWEALDGKGAAGDMNWTPGHPLVVTFWLVEVIPGTSLQRAIEF
ncbi:hypothetical protein LIER_00791 [Lithospermum erythrorhizon]|uniref:Uncharacterized protein n=1 Tax=Lithospermum erythrorhizon TaxID=34254 RepID=A0AAV3NJQ8_LITER